MTASVLHVAASSLASPTGGGRTRIVALARQGQQHGHRVRILCFFPAHHAISRRTLLRTGRTRLEQEAGCRVHYAPRFPLTRIAGVHWLNNWYCAFIVRMACWLHGITVVHAHTVKPALFACMARRLGAGIRIVADVHGVETDEYLYETNRTEPDDHARRLRAYETTIAREADWVVFVSDVMRRVYEEQHGGAVKHASVIPCATDLTASTTHRCRDTLRQEYQLAGRLVFAYAGSSESYQLPDVMCRLFRQVLTRYPNAFFLIFSHHRDAFLRYLEAEGIEPGSYRVQGVDRSEIFDLLQMGDVGLLLRSDSIVNRVASPTKFAEYCICGLPVITTPHVGDFSDMVRQHQLGLVVDLDHLTVDEAMETFLAEVQEQRAAYSRRCACWAKTHLSWTAFGGVVDNIYQSVASGAAH